MQKQQDLATISGDVPGVRPGSGSQLQGRYESGRREVRSRRSRLDITLEPVKGESYTVQSGNFKGLMGICTGTTVSKGAYRAHLTFANCVHAWIEGYRLKAAL